MNPLIRTVIVVLLITALLFTLWLVLLPTGLYRQVTDLLQVRDGVEAAHVQPTVSPSYLLYLIFSGFNAAAGILLFIIFRKTTSPELLYLIMSVLALSVVGLRYPLTLAAGNPQLVLTRTLLLGSEAAARIFFLFYIFAVLLFFFAGLFSNGIPLLKQNIFLVVTIFISVSLIFLLPIDHFRLLPSRPNPFSYTGLLVLAIRAAEGFAALNYVIASQRGSNSQYLLLAVSLVLLFGGLELFLAVPQLTGMIIGLTLYAGGLLMFTNRMYSIHLWS